jgi:DNA-binding GntR family transcriptional regulator
MSAQSTKTILKPPVSLRDRVYDYVKKQIIDGFITPSDVITELSLSKQIGISRTPVREALHYLEKEGLLVSLPMKGYKVRKISRQELEEICEIRSALESLSIKWAMQRITPEQLRSLEDNMITAERKISDDDMLAFTNLDGEFHEMIAKASGNQQLVDIILSLRNDMIRSRVQGLNKEGIKRALQGHRNIFKCLVEKDASCAETAIRSHLEDLKHDSKGKEKK